MNVRVVYYISELSEIRRVKMAGVKRTKFPKMNMYKKDADKTPLEFTETEGFRIPKLLEGTFLKVPLQQHMENVKSMEIRDDDLILCTYAKCGTHWAWEILHMLTTGTAQMSKQVKEVAMLEFKHIPEIDELPSPRILNTHLPLHLLPRDIKGKNKKMVFVYRNVKDVSISAYHHFEKTAVMLDCTLDTMEKFKTIFATKGCIPYDYFQYMREFDEFFTANPDFPALVLSYEDLIHEPLKQVRRMAEFVGKDYDEKLLQDIVHECSFDKMKHAALNYKEQSFGNTTPDGESVMYRKGKAGDWKNNFTVAENELYDAVIEQKLGNVKNLHFEYV